MSIFVLFESNLNVSVNIFSITDRAKVIHVLCQTNIEGDMERKGMINF